MRTESLYHDSQAEGWPRVEPAKRGGDPKGSVTHRIAEGLPVKSLKSLQRAPKSGEAEGVGVGVGDVGECGHGARRMLQPRAPILASASARSFIACPLWARTCLILTTSPRLRKRASTALFASTIFLFDLGFHAPVVVCDADTCGRVALVRSTLVLVHSPLWCTRRSGALAASPAGGADPRTQWGGKPAA